MFSNKQIPSTGGSIGIERIFNILEMRAKKENKILNPSFAFVGSMGNVDRSTIFELADWMWEKGFTTEVFYEDMKVGDQILAALSRGA